MPSVDFEYGLNNPGMNPYGVPTDPAAAVQYWGDPTPTGEQQVPVAAAPTPTPTPAAAPTVVGQNLPNAGKAPDWQTMMGYLINSPMYKQGMESLQKSYADQAANNQAMYGYQQGLDYTSTWRPDQAFMEQYMGQSFTPDQIPQAYYDRLQFEADKAQREYQTRQKQIQEVMASRGMLDSGQTGYELGDSAYTYDTLLQDIALGKNLREQELTAQNTNQQRAIAEQNARGQFNVDQSNAARAQSVAQSNAEAAAGAAKTNANAAIQKQILGQQYQYQQSQLDTARVQDTNTLLNNTASFYKDLWWNGAAYVGPGAV